MDFPMRINKYIAHQGIASRREADALIEKKHVTLNGKTAVLGDIVNEHDVVEVSTKNKTKKHYFAYYKGRGIITHSPGEGETDIATKIATDYNLTDVYPVGRLDKDSEGLIILTNDGRVTRELLAPEHGHERVYDVIVDKNVTGWTVKHLEEGVNIEGYTTKPAKAEKHPKNPKRFTISLTEGKKHQIRRMCAALGYQVQTLKRVRIANIELGKLKPNQYRKIAGKELDTFLNTLSIKK